MMKRIGILTMIMFSMLQVRAQYGFTMNCDSLKRVLSQQIDSLKKQSADKMLIEQMENVRKQLVELYCNEQPVVIQGSAKPAGTAKAAQQKNAAPMNQPAMPSQSGAMGAVNFSANYAITIDIQGEDSEGQMQRGVIQYFLDVPGKRIFLDRNSFRNSAGLQAAFVPEEGGTFDGWLIDNNGKHSFYSTAQEYGKIVSQMQMNVGGPNEKPAIKVKALPGTKIIAGYACKSYQITGNDKGEPVNLTCWVTNQDLPFLHPGFTMFSMMSAGQLMIPGSAKRGVMSIEGRSSEGAYNFTVKAIEASQKQVNLSGYKLFTMPSF